jgi:serine/threonine protein kinase
VHQAGLVHRDVKPANLFLTQRPGGEELCKVLDFGVAKLASSDASLPGTLLGTVRYMAPEQLANNAAIGPATDVYAVGAILYQCLTGSAPHRGETLEELMFEIMTRPAPDVRERRPEVPPELASLLERALRRDITERTESAAEFGRALQAFAVPSQPTVSVSGSDPTIEEGSPARVGLAPVAPQKTRWRSTLALGALFAAGLWLGRLTAPMVHVGAFEPATPTNQSNSHAPSPKVEAARPAPDANTEPAEPVTPQGDTPPPPRFESTSAPPATARNARPSSAQKATTPPSGPRFDTKNPYAD